jgi:hypothetical protein
MAIFTGALRQKPRRGVRIARRMIAASGVPLPPCERVDNSTRHSGSTACDGVRSAERQVTFKVSELERTLRIGWSIRQRSSVQQCGSRRGSQDRRRSSA